MNCGEVILEQAKLIAGRRAHAMVTILHSDGSTPRTSGKMLVREDGGTAGSIGGGEAERMATADALDCLAQCRGGVREYDLTHEGSNTGMVCGGRISVFIEVYPAPQLLVMCGGGHVGAAVMRLAAMLGYEILLVDDRAGSAALDTGLASEVITTGEFQAGRAEHGRFAGAYCVIATPGHAFDRAALRAALGKGFAYIGMIGSRAKIAATYETLRAEGVESSALEEVYAPIGLDTGGETPEEIALSIMAEIQAVRYGRSGAHLRDTAGRREPCRQPAQ